MKKLVIAVFLSIFPIIAFAQGPISFGPKIGWNTNRLTTDYKEYIKDCKSGFQGGLFFSIYLNKFYIQPEAYFSLKRGALEASLGNPYDPNSTLDIKQSVKLQSIDIPVLVGFKVLDLKLVRFRVWGGPVASYLLNKEYDFSINGNHQPDRITRDDFRNATWSAQVGAGVDVLMLTFDVGYQFGLDSFLTIHSLDNFNFQNNVFYCSLGWRLF
jgi:hypothetical protein